MTGSPEEDCVEKMLLNAPSGGYTNYSPSIQVSKHQFFYKGVHRGRAVGA